MKPQHSAEIRVLVAHFRPDIVSGAELAIGDMVKAIGTNFRFTMLTPGPGRLADHYGCRGLDVWAERIHTRRRKYPGLHSIQSRLFAMKLRRRGIRAALCNTFPAASRVGTGCRLARIPYAVYVREYIRNTELHRRILAKADAVYAVSADVATYLRDLAPEGKTFVVRDFVDAEAVRERETRHRSSGARALPFPDGAPVVGIVGRLSSYKKQDLFLRSVPHVLSRVPEARFVVVGSATAEERDYASGLEKLAEALGVSEKVAFLGQRPDAIEILSELNVCCLTSDREPFPRTILEAQLVGCPVVASNTGGCPELVEDGVTGLLFPVLRPDAPERLADAVVRLLQDPGLTSSLRENARGNVLAGAGSRAPVQVLEDRLRQLARRAPAPGTSP